MKRGKASPETRSILNELIGALGADLRDDLQDVLIVQNEEKVWLMMVTDTGASSIDLDFITSGDETMCTPGTPIEENVAQFLDMADVESLCMTTDLIKPDVCQECLEQTGQ